MLKEFDVSSYRSDAMSLVVGNYRNGKTTLANKLISIGEFENGLVFNRSRNEYGMQNAEVHDEYNTVVLGEFIKGRKASLKTGRRTRDFVVFDNCFPDSKFCKDDNIRFMFFNNRGIRTSAIFTMMYPMGMSPAFRGNIDYVFVFRYASLQHRKTIYDMYVSWLLDFGEFESSMEEIQTKIYHCLVIDNVNKELFIYNSQKYNEQNETLTCPDSVTSK